MRQLLISLLLVTSITAAGQRDIPKRAFGITVSFPWVNNLVFYEYQFERTASKPGFGGLSGSLFYKTQKEKISLSIGVLLVNPVPMGPYDPDFEEHTDIYATYIEGTFHKRVLERLRLIAGLNYTEYAYSYYKDRISLNNTIDFTGGITTGAEYLFGRKNFSLAVFYRPALIHFDGMRSKYRHAISLDARIDINVFRRFN